MKTISEKPIIVLKARNGTTHDSKNYEISATKLKNAEVGHIFTSLYGSDFTDSMSQSLQIITKSETSMICKLTERGYDKTNTLFIKTKMIRIKFLYI